MEDLGYLETLPNLYQGAIGIGFGVKNLIFEIHCNKTNNMAFGHINYSEQPRHWPSLIKSLHCALNK